MNQNWSFTTLEFIAEKPTQQQRNIYPTTQESYGTTLILEMTAQSFSRLAYCSWKLTPVSPLRTYDFQKISVLIMNQMNCPTCKPLEDGFWNKRTKAIWPLHSTRQSRTVWSASWILLQVSKIQIFGEPLRNRFLLPWKRKWTFC